MTFGSSAPLLVLVLSLVVLFAPTVAAGGRGGGRGMLVAVAVLHAASVLASTGAAAFAAIALIAAIRIGVLPGSMHTARVALGVVVLASAAAAAGLAMELPVVALTGSLVSIAVLTGLLPFHSGVANLAEHAPPRLTEQLASGIIVVFAHLRFVAPLPLADAMAPTLVRAGALLTLLPALMALVQPDLRGFYRAAVVMHAGMLLAGVGAAGRGHAAAALLLVVTMMLALGGLGVMVASVEERAGRIVLQGRGGRIAAFPRLAAAFLLFAAAGVGMPGTAGFMADDLLLHALWEESAGGSLTVVGGTALLAVATLMTFARVFLGPPSASLAPDLRAGERLIAVVLMLVLIVIGIVPSLLVDPVSEYLRMYGAMPH